MTFSERAVEAAAKAMVLLAKERHDAGASLPSRLDEARVALAAALAVDGLVLQGWRTITTTDEPPRDVPLLLGWWRVWPDRAWECAAGLYGSTKGGWIHGQATHWQPLPAPPLTAASDGEVG